MPAFGRRMQIASTFLAAAIPVQMARASQPPPDVCSLLPASEVSKTLGSEYSPPEKHVAPRPYRDTVEGTDCTYRATGVGETLLFRVYFDPSATAATDLFAKLKMFYQPPAPVAGIGDEAYFDPRLGLHARKGNVRFFLSLSNLSTVSPAQAKRLRDLTAEVAGRL